MFSSLKRKDQRATAGVYARGFMLDGRRKAMQPMAQRLGVDHQRLQQFVTTSPWDVVPVRKTLSRKACDLIVPDAWVMDAASPRTGTARPGWHSSTRERWVRSATGIAVSVHAATDAASAPLDWRLFLPESWDDQSTTHPEAVAAITARRTRSAVPETEHHRRKWELALEMLDELIEWGRIQPTVVADADADAGYGDATAFREGLTDRGIGYVVAVKGATTAYPGDVVPETAACTGRGRPPTPRYQDPHSTCKDLVLAPGTSALQDVTWRRGTRPTPESHRGDALKVRRPVGPSGEP